MTWMSISNAFPYQVSDSGEIQGKTKILVPVRQKSGYYTVTFLLEGKVKTHRIQHLVLNAFVGPRPVGYEARHLDGNPANNALTNLRWGTKKENAQDRRLHGTQLTGTANPMARLTETQVLEIVALHGRVTQREIANRYGISRRTVQTIQYGEHWKELTGL